MSQVKPGLLYTQDHEWAIVTDDQVTIGITDHAQSELGDVVFVEMPEVGVELIKGQSFGTIEAVKTVAELYAPVTGTVVAVNEALADMADNVNKDPYGEGWIIKIRYSKPEELATLLDSNSYNNFIN
jgi:glycine cleavage system H protein